MRLSNRFATEETGAIVPFSLILVIIFFVIGGVAVDVSNAYQRRTHLQVAADAAAHAALMAREYYTAEASKVVGVDIAKGSLPDDSYGEVIQPEDILFGHWDADAQVFTPDPNATSAVMVETSRLAERMNAEPTFFLSFVGIHEWNIRSRSVFETYYPSCLREGFVGDDVVEITSGNLYVEGFCVHSNNFVDLNSGNVFQEGTIVSMPDRREISGPTSMYESNQGLGAALRDASYRLRIVRRIEEIYEGIQEISGPYARDYVTSSTIINVNRNSAMDESTFTPGRVHRINCNSNGQKIQIPNGTTLEQIVIVTNCKVQFGQGVALEDVVIATTSTDNKSFNAASGVRLGRDDNCAPGGGAQLVTMGGVEIPSDLKMFGGQILAALDVSFTANANGIEGASIVAGGRIDGTANSVMAFCEDGMESNFEAAYFRMAG